MYMQMHLATQTKGVEIRYNLNGDLQDIEASIVGDLCDFVFSIFVFFSFFALCVNVK